MKNIIERPPTPKLDDVWLKAAALGCLWASCEIVLGGFLHNLRVPMAGNIMAGIGIVLMIAVAHLWPIRGLLWRAGLICALMKSLAPAAVIFGPMIAITCQACLMELAVRILRRNPFSYALGAMLAMSWNIVQLAINTLLAYGNRAIDLYMAVAVWSQKNLGLSADRVWLPVALILAVHLVFGLVAGLLGLYVGQRAAAEPLAMSSLTTAQVMEIRSMKAGVFPYSTAWLFTNLFVLIIVLILTSYAGWIFWLPAGLLAMGVWLRRYRESIRSLLRPSFWLWFILITILAGMVFGSVRNGWHGLLDGVENGLAMNFRAAFLLIGLSALAIELRSPRMGKALARGRFRQLPSALEAAVETLPWVVANLPRLQETFRRPVTVFHQVVAQADFWLKRLTLRQAQRQDVLLLCGRIGEGKSGFLRALIDVLHGDNRHVAGILSPAVHDQGRRIGYDLVDIARNEQTELSRIVDHSEQNGRPRVGNYAFRLQGIELGKKALSVSTAAAADVILIDEIGPWELQDQGWAGALYGLILETRMPMIWVVRADIVGQVVTHWGLQNPEIVDLSVNSSATLLARVREWLSQCSKSPAPAAESHPASAEWSGVWITSSPSVREAH